MATKPEIETMAKLVTRYFPGIKYAGCRFDERWATVDIYYHAYHAPYFLCWPYRVEVPRCNHMSLAEFRKTLIKNISKVLHMEPINPHTGRPMKPLDIDEISERAQEIIEQIPYKYLDSVTRITAEREPGSEINRGKLTGIPVDASGTVKEICSAMVDLWRERRYPNGDIIKILKSHTEAGDTYYFDIYVNSGIADVDWPTNEITVDRKWNERTVVRMADCQLDNSVIRFVVNVRTGYCLWPVKNPALATAALNSTLGRRPDFCCLDEWINTTAVFDTINKEENTMKYVMNVKYMIKVMIDSNRVGKYSDGSYNKAVLNADLRRLLVHYEIERDEYINHYKKCEPTKIIYNGPATIVFFKDGDKVVVKRQEGDYNDREKAVAMAIMKKTLGTNENKTNYLDSIKKLMKEADKEERKQQVAKSKELIDKARAELSGRMEFTKFQAAGWLAWHDTCKKKHIGPGCEKAIATEMGYETITRFRKAKKAAQVKAKEE